MKTKRFTTYCTFSFIIQATMGIYVSCKPKPMSNPSSHNFKILSAVTHINILFLIFINHVSFDIKFLTPYFCQTLLGLLLQTPFSNIQLDT